GGRVQGDKYLWDPTEITSASPHECQIYHLPPGRIRGLKVRSSFWDFIRWVDKDVRSWMLFDGGAPRGIPFWPTELRKKVVPTWPDVKQWLAWNNNTVRDLALAIRDREQTDAFPILADALQEAGCTNADLLNSCRTGDPDIDGIWVLRVLL